MLELVTTVICPLNRMPLRLFRHVDTGEGAVIAGELAIVMGYGSLSRVLRASEEYAENIHFFLLAGQPLRSFKEYLATQNIRAYRRASRLCLMSETGVAFLLGRHCREQAVRVGEWLLGEVFPLLRHQYPIAAYQKITSIYLNCEFYVLLWRGRFGIMFSHLFELLGVPHLDHVSRALHSYVPNLHIDSWPEPPQDNDAETDALGRHEAFLFYPSGLYRYWNCSHHPLLALMRLCFEREVWPQCRRGAWVALPEEEEARRTPTTQLAPARRPAELCAMEPVPGYPGIADMPGEIWQQLRTEINRETAPLAESLQRLEQGIREWSDRSASMLQQHAEKLQTLDGQQQRLAQEWREQSMRLLARLDGLRDMYSSDASEADTSAPTETAPSGEQGKLPTPLSLLKELARALHLYYLDRQTPHLVFVRALIAHARSRSTQALRRVLTEDLKLKPGENQVSLGDNTYRLWYD